MRKRVDADADHADADSDDDCTPTVFKRQKSYITYKETGKKDTSYRPKTLYRVKSKRSLMNVDNSVRVTTRFRGIAFWKFDDKIVL